MASVYEALLRPLLAPLAALGLTPGAVSVLALAGSVAAGLVVSRGRAEPARLLLLSAWLLARMALNAIEGMMAREMDRATPLGAVLNELGDVLSDMALYLPLALVEPGAGGFVLAFVLGAVLTEFCGVLGSALGAGRRSEGPMGKSDRALAVGTLGAATFAWREILPYWPWLFLALAGLTVLTCARRVGATLAALAARTSAS